MLKGLRELLPKKTVGKTYWFSGATRTTVTIIIELLTYFHVIAISSTVYIYV